MPVYRSVKAFMSDFSSYFLFSFFQGINYMYCLEFLSLPLLCHPDLHNMVGSILKNKQKSLTGIVGRSTRQFVEDNLIENV